MENENTNEPLNNQPTQNSEVATTPELSYRQLRMKTYKKIIRWMWRLYIVAFSMVVALFVWLSTKVPPFEKLENPRSRIASVVYSSDGEVLGKYYIENRTPVEFDSISPHVINALIATEDARFYNHAGIDARAIGRVVFKTILGRNENAGGGSTITQQLAKLLIGRPDTEGMGSLQRYWTIFTTKLTEWLTAVQLEKAYTKEEILTLYLNEFDFLFGADGIRSASETYFGKHPKDLTINESAMLVRMLKNPSSYNPRLFYDKALEGRMQVLFNMQMKGHLTREDYDRLKVEPIDLSNFSRKDHNDGIATHFREHLRTYVRDLLKDEDKLQRPRNADGEPWDIYRDGLKIYTTIDSKMQQYAEEAVFEHLSEHQEKMFDHWANWRGDIESGSKAKYNPWTYKSRGVGEFEIFLRFHSFERLIWQTPRYQLNRDKYLKTAVAEEVTNNDIFYMLQLEDLPEANGRRNSEWNRDVFLNKLLQMKYIGQADVDNYKRILANNDLWSKIKEEYQHLIEYIDRPVEMKVFAYNEAGETDTIMSPIDSIRYHRMHLQVGSMAVDPVTGYIRAWVGGPNHKYFKYDHVNKTTARQVGSTIKPFLYGLTIDQKGYSPCHQVFDAETTIEAGYGGFGLIRDWTPKNAGGGYSGRQLTLVEALRMSLNSVSAKLMKDLGSVHPLRTFLHEAGIDTSKVPNSPTICLGTADLSVYEMVGGYSMFVNGGYYAEPIFIERIEDANGNIIYEPDPVFDRVMHEQGAFAMNQMLQTVQRGAGGFRGIKCRYGGKTGTTDYQSDGWFMGITPQVVLGTWVGCDDRFIRFRSLAYGQGAKMARPIFQNFIRKLEADPESGFDINADYPRPDVEAIQMKCINYARLTGPGDELFDQVDYTDDDDDWDRAEDGF